MDTIHVVGILTIFGIALGAWLTVKISEWLFPPRYVQMQHGYPVEVPRAQAERVLAEKTAQAKKQSERWRP